MEYKIKVEKITPREANYPARETVYEQVVEDLDLEKVIKAVNEID